MIDLVNGTEKFEKSDSDLKTGLETTKIRK